MIRLVLVLGLLGFAAHAQPPAGARLETEYKLAVPRGEDEVVWRWLRAYYAHTKPPALGAGWTSNFGEETFRDRYFDVAANTLMGARAGLRHRQRFDTTGRLTKQLVQLKTTDDAAGLLRQELKFKPVEGATAETPLADLLHPADRLLLDAALAPLGVALADVAPAFVLAQRRRRLYFLLDGAAFSTITLDSSYCEGRPAATFTEIELELNEKRYTGASEAERTRMRVILDSIRADMFRQFPALQQDQRPKYEKMARLLAAQPKGAVSVEEGAGATSVDPPYPKSRAPYWVGGALVGLALGWWVLRRQRRRQ